MRILLDSHVVLWWLDDSAAMGPRCRELIRNADEAFISAVTPWELGIKRALGKLTLITAAHAESAPELPTHHRDPFDRMLIAQAQLETLVLVTAERLFRATR